MIVEVVKTTIEEAINAAISAVEKGYKFVTAVEIAGLHYIKLDASDVVKAVEADAEEIVAPEPQKPVETAEVVAEVTQAPAEEVVKPAAKKGKK
jgi:hypothetical protein